MIDRIGRILEKDTGKGFRKKGQHDNDTAHDRNTSVKNDTRYICQAFPILFTDTDAEQHTGNDSHAGRNCPEEPHDGIRRRKGRHTYASNIAHDQ